MIMMKRVEASCLLLSEDWINLRIRHSDGVYGNFGYPGRAFWKACLVSLCHPVRTEIALVLIAGLYTRATPQQSSRKDKVLVMEVSMYQYLRGQEDTPASTPKSHLLLFISKLFMLSLINSNYLDYDPVVLDGSYAIGKGANRVRMTVVSIVDAHLHPRDIAYV